MPLGHVHIPTPEVVDPHTLEELARAPHRTHFAQAGQHRSSSRLWRTLTWPLRLALRLLTWPLRRALRAFLD